ncbi:hypothetical protein EVAR_1002_1 [Eumeta japonica]|uniref:Uncharacterized protein n=1 Tax=Eumeta variegata TaxID=151549 RepID=A0A4C1SEK0_EUMVA|nr:hypothetical protein EVAR_1002_1 [Eumeta japonica]
MTVKGRLQRPPVMRMGSDSIRTIPVATMLGVAIDGRFSFAKHAQSIGERAAKEFWQGIQSVGRIVGNAKSVPVDSLPGDISGYNHARCARWHMCVNLHMVRSALLRTQRLALTQLTKVCRTISTAALPVPAVCCLMTMKLP